MTKVPLNAPFAKCFPLNRHCTYLSVEITDAHCTSKFEFFILSFQKVTTLRTTQHFDFWLSAKWNTRRVKKVQSCKRIEHSAWTNGRSEALLTRSESERSRRAILNLILWNAMSKRPLASLPPGSFVFFMSCVLIGWCLKSRVLIGWWFLRFHNFFFKGHAPSWTITRLLTPWVVRYFFMSRALIGCLRVCHFLIGWCLRFHHLFLKTTRPVFFHVSCSYWLIPSISCSHWLMMPSVSSFLFKRPRAVFTFLFKRPRAVF